MTYMARKIEEATAALTAANEKVAEWQAKFDAAPEGSRDRIAARLHLRNHTQKRDWAQSDLDRLTK